MLSFFLEQNPVLLAFLGGTFTFLVTALGSSLVFFLKKVNKTYLDSMLALSAGIMLSASFFSLLNPCIEKAKELNLLPWLIAFLGFVMGGLFLYFSDILFEKKVCKKNKSKKRNMLILAITLHNIPEGLAVGTSFGILLYNKSPELLLSALVLTLGIGLQNFPEGSAVSLPLRREKLSTHKSFFIGALTAIVEPISALIGALLVMKIQSILPFLLAFAGGAMIYVVCQELVPECQKNKNQKLMTLLIILGFSIMMILDVMFA